MFRSRPCPNVACEFGSDDDYRTVRQGYVVIAGDVQYRMLSLRCCMQTACRQSGLRSRRAFTMLETLVVIIVVGILMAVSYPKMHNQLVHQRIARAASAAQNSLETAFAIAARNRRPIRISWSSSAMQLDVTDRAGTTYYRRTGLGQSPYGLLSSNVTFSQSPVEVYPNGLANSALTITFNVQGDSTHVVMSRAGMVKLQ